MIFHPRQGTSDQKTFDEVVKGNLYQKNFPITKDMYCVDMGMNVGAFGMVCGNIGCGYIGYEPDAVSVKQAQKNYDANGYDLEIVNAGVCYGNQKSGFLNISDNGNYWRNSFFHTFKGGKKVKCDLMNIKNEIPKRIEKANGRDIFLKIDIEGSEMDILENVDLSFAKYIVFEWSFDIDPSITRYMKLEEKLLKDRSIEYRNFKKSQRTEPVRKKSWFPMYIIGYMRKK